MILLAHDRGKSEMPKMTVYLIRSRSEYKIGRTGNFQQRLQYIDQALPYIAEVIYRFETDDSPSLERYLHRRFAEFRLRRDWYRLSPEHVAEIQAIDAWPPFGGIPDIPQHPLRRSTQELLCKRCGYQWQHKGHEPPMRCAKCRAVGWQEPITFPQRSHPGLAGRPRRPRPESS
jgi:hypothetical protein